VEGLLAILQDLVALTLATIGIGLGIRTACGDVKALRQPLVRLVSSIVFVSIGLWIFYIGIRHLVAG
jgi:ABC-type nickel/cobalt efflux system permease component RcnA